MGHTATRRGRPLARWSARGRTVELTTHGRLRWQPYPGASFITVATRATRAQAALYAAERGIARRHGR